ncbi:MAG: HAD hydrolase family protein [Moraxellaceae bacterium]|nr:HAD hydrolase family protein [Moraxellaceae bacterium]
MNLEKVLDKATKIKLLALDVDGILSDGKIIYDANGIETKAFYVQDGVGIKALQNNAIQVAIITGRTSPMVAKRAEELGIKHIIQGRDDKGIALQELADSLNLQLAECAYMGDDLPDIKALQIAGLAVTVPNAHNEVKQRADFITKKSGGNGAVREVCDMILQEKGLYQAFIEKYI